MIMFKVFTEKMLSFNFQGKKKGIKMVIICTLKYDIFIMYMC